MVFIRIQKTERREYYRTPGNQMAEVRHYPTQGAVLTVRDENGETVFQKEYVSRKSAMIGLGLRFGKCEFDHMMDSIQTKREG